MKSFNARLLTAAITVPCMLALVGCTGNCPKAVDAQPTLFAAETDEPNAPSPPAEPNAFEDKWGIKVESVRFSAGGYMVDFRFRVLDPNKAAPIFDRKIHPYLVDQKTGATFAVPNPPKVGQLRSGKSIRAGAIYFIFFANPGQYIKSGSTLKIVIGECEIRDLVI